MFTRRQLMKSTAAISVMMAASSAKSRAAAAAIAETKEAPDVTYRGRTAGAAIRSAIRRDDTILRLGGDGGIGP